MSPREVQPPGNSYSGSYRVFSTKKKAWDKLCQTYPGPMRGCYIALADSPFPPFPTPRHHQMHGKLKDFWEYEVAGGVRVRYRRGDPGTIAAGCPIVVYAGTAPPDTH